MSDKQMEGDNQRRRALARQARNQGRRASQESASLGSSKQRGAPATRPVAAPAPAPSGQRPTEDRLGTAPPDDPLARRYREVVGEVGRRIGVGFEEARSAAEATVTVAARTLNEGERRRFLERLPAELHDEYAVNVPYPPRGLAGFIEEVGRISHSEPEVARVQAQAVLSVLAEEDRELVDSVHLPAEVRDLIAPVPAGGGLLGPGGLAGPGAPGAPLTDAEVRDALAGLPYWTGDRIALRRTVSLPRDNLDRVLDQLAGLRGEQAHRPRIVRDGPDSATLVVRSAGLGAVTRLDVDLAHRIDAAIDDAGAGMAG
jgi:uncharacterized protein (DUF2267 family)/pterin-4a-carbinolamine dehydratase